MRAIPMLEGSVNGSKGVVEQKTVPATAIELVKRLRVRSHGCDGRASKGCISQLAEEEIPRI